MAPRSSFHKPAAISDQVWAAIKAAPSVIAYADPAPLPKNPNGSDPDGGDWSTYWYNGKIYESDIYRGVMVWDLDNAFTNRAKTVEIANPQTQIGAYAPDNVKPTVTSANEGKGYTQGSTVPAAFTCADEGLGVESCTSHTTNLDTATIGEKTYTVTAVDNAGNTTEHTVNFMVNSTDVAGGGGASVPATVARIVIALRSANSVRCAALIGSTASIFPVVYN